MSEPLDFRQLEAFVAVVASGSITAAADLLGRSQPGVTRQIQELEASLGFRLFDRAGRSVALTERGAQFHTEAERHLVSLSHLRQRADAIRAGRTAALELAAIPAFAAGLALEAVAELTRGRPVATHLRAAGGEEVVQLVLDRVSDLGLCSLPVRSPGLDIHWVAEVPCIALLRADDPLAAAPVLALPALAGRRVITTANPYRLRRHVDEALRAAGLDRPEPLDANTSFGAMGAVRAGLGVALIEPLTPLGAPVEGLVVRPLDRHLPFRYGAITASGRTPPDQILALIDRLRDVLADRVPGLRLAAAGQDEWSLDETGPP